MTSIPSPEELKKSRNIIPTYRLVLWAEKSGFITRNSGSSHIVCKHNTFEDINFILIRDTDKLDSKRDFANALIALRNRMKECTPAFSKTQSDKIDDVRNALPPYIEAERNHKTGQIVLRDRNLPQLGLTLQPGEEGIIENKVRYLEDMKREAFKLLSRARMNYDINAGMDHGVFTGQLSHQVYRNLPKAMITPYQAGEMPDKIFTGLQAYIARVEERDLEHRIRLEDALDSPVISGIFVAFHARRGDRTNRVVYERPSKDEGTLSFEFKTRSNRRAETDDVHCGRMTNAELTRVEKIMAGIKSKAGISNPAPT